MKRKVAAEDRISRLVHTSFMAPRYRRGLPCAIENYCSLDCRRRVSGMSAYDCFRQVCKKRLHYYENEEIPIAYCVKKKCKSLLQSGASLACMKFRREQLLSSAPHPPSGHMRLRLRWKERGWTYRDV
jgi:hypothetical protein